MNQEHPVELLDTKSENGAAVHSKEKISPFVHITDGRELEKAESLAGL